MSRNDKIRAEDLPARVRRELLGTIGDRWGELKLLEAAGTIKRLERQVTYPLHAFGGEEITSYVADFRYLEGSHIVVEDAKGFKTATYRLKRKWMLAEYGITIRET